MRNHSLYALSLGLCTLAFPSLARAEPLPTQPDEGMTNAAHKEHAGEIATARKPIDRASPSTADFAKEFNLTDPIYMRVYLKESTANTLLRNGVKCANEARRELWVILDGKPVEKDYDNVYSYSEVSQSGNEYRKSTTFSWEGDNKRALNGSVAGHPVGEIEGRFVTGLLPRLTPGKHTLQLVVRASCFGEWNGKSEDRRLDEPLAQSEITLNVKAADLQRFAKANGPKMPAPGMKDKALEGQVMGLVKKEFSGDEIHKVVITSTSWHVTNHETTGIPKERSVEVFAVLKQSGHDGCASFTLMANEDYAGKGKWNAPRLFIGTRNDFPCSSAH